MYLGSGHTHSRRNFEAQPTSLRGERHPESCSRETESGSPYCGFGVVAHLGGNDSDSALPRFFQFPTELRLECGPLHKSVRWPEYCTISASANTCFVDNSIQARNNPRHLLAIEEKRYAVRPPAVVELCTRGVECGAELEIGRSPDFPLAQPNCWLIANKVRSLRVHIMPL
jgi:hypothetical protein